MRVSVLIVMFILGIVGGLWGCDRSDEESGDDSREVVDELEPQEESVEGREEAGLYRFIGETMVARPFASLNEFVAIGCECEFDEYGFESEQQCRDERVLADSLFEEAIQCAVESAHDQPHSAPEGTDTVVSCLSESVDAIDECFQVAFDAHGCDDHSPDNYSRCFGQLSTILQDGAEVCAVEEVNGEIEDWFEELGHTLRENECFEPLDVFKR